MVNESDSLAERMAMAARVLQDTQVDPQETYDAAVQLAVSNVRGCDAAAFSLVHAKAKVDTPASTDDLALRGDQLQYELREGPCLDAIWDEQVVHSADLRIDSRWPAWGPKVSAETGANSVMCFQLFTHEDTVGGLNLYSRRTNGFDVRDRDDGLALAAHIAVAVVAAQKIDQLTTAVGSRTVIGQAVGMLMERYELDPDRAFQVLVRTSSSSSVRIRELAETIVTTRRLPGTTEE